MQIALPITIGLGCFAAAGANDLEAGNTTGIALFVYASIAALVFFCWRRHIPLAASLLRVSANGLAANPGLIPTVILLNIASLLAVAPLGIMAGERAVWQGVGERGCCVPTNSFPALLPSCW